MALTFEEVKWVLLAWCHHVEEPDKVWHAVQGLQQNESEDVADFLKKFMG